MGAWARPRNAPRWHGPHAGSNALPVAFAAHRYQSSVVRVTAPVTLPGSLTSYPINTRSAPLSEWLQPTNHLVHVVSLFARCARPHLRTPRCSAHPSGAKVRVLYSRALYRSSSPYLGCQVEDVRVRLRGSGARGLYLALLQHLSTWLFVLELNRGRMWTGARPRALIQNIEPTDVTHSLVRPPIICSILAVELELYSESRELGPSAESRLQHRDAPEIDTTKS